MQQRQNQQMFQRLQQIELAVTFGVPGLVLFIAFIVIGAIINPYVSALFPTWILFASVPWWASWSIFNILLAGLGVRWLSRYYQRKLITAETTIIRPVPVQSVQFDTVPEPEPITDPDVIVVEGSRVTSR